MLGSEGSLNMCFLNKAGTLKQSIPLLTRSTGGRIRSNIALQNARWKQTQILYQSTVLNSLEETEDALVNDSQEQERRDRLQAAMSQNQTALELSQELYTSGLGDFLAVLDAELRFLVDAGA